MTVPTTYLSTYIDPSMPPLNGWAASAGLSTIVMSPLVALMELCLISLLVFGGLWLKGRYPKPGFHRYRSTEKPTELSSTYDYVTGLPTRRLFETLLEQSVGRATKTGRPLTLFVVELEHFRMVAESQDQVLSNVAVRVQAARIRGVLRSTETVARLAQNQFMMILDNLTTYEEVMPLLIKLQVAVGLPLTLNGNEIFMTCRIGVASYPQDAKEHDGLIKEALRAVNTAKSWGQAVQFASPIGSSTALVIASCESIDRGPVQFVSPAVASPTVALAAPEPMSVVSSITDHLPNAR